MSRQVRTCCVEGCKQKHRRNGFCNTHSKRIERHGDLGRHYPWACHSDEERRERLKQRQRRYDKSPKGKAASILKRHRRRHREGDKIALTVDDVLAIKTKFDFQCFKCRSKIDLTLDHHVPLAKGGKFIIENVVLLCRTCNGLKADALPDEFYSVEELSVLRNLLESGKISNA